MGKIVTLGSLQKLIKPYTATLVGGGFDLLHVGHLRYLEKSSKFGRPLIVIVQSDRVVFARKGFGRPIIRQSHRAELVAGLECVDYVIVLSKPSHYDGYLERIKPRRLIFYKENLAYRKRRAREITKKFPSIQVIFIHNRKISSTSRIVKKILERPTYQHIKNPVARKLHCLAMRSASKSGKVSAVLMRKGKLIAQSGNNRNDEHAEDLIIRSIKKPFPFKECELVVLIPPCISCSELILKSGIKQVYYLYPYGNDDGVKLLRNNGVRVRKFSVKV